MAPIKIRLVAACYIRFDRTENQMTDIAEPPADDARPSRLGKLLPLLLPVLALAAGFGSSFMGFWSPMSLISGSEAAPAEHAPLSEVTFVDVPRIILTVPGERTRTLSLTVMIEVPPEQKSQALALMPRITDSYNGFLSRIDATAFGRRGILEIVRAELATRTRFILGDAAVRDLLITEFRIQ